MSDAVLAEQVTQSMAEAVVEAARVVSALGLTTAFGHVSARLDAHTILITPPVPLHEVTAADLMRVALGCDVLPDGAAPETWAHLAVYAARPDVGAVVRAMPPASFAAGLLARDHRLLPQHGQGAWLGEYVAVHNVPRLLRTPELAAAATERLGAEQALILQGNGAITVGADPAVAATRMWLLDSLCQVRVGAPTGAELSREDGDAWRVAAPALVDRLWQYLRSAPDVSRHPARRSPLA